MDWLRGLLLVAAAAAFAAVGCGGEEAPAASQASATTPVDPTPKYLPPGARSASTVLAVCRREKPRPVAGLRVGGGLVNVAPLTAESAARLLSQMGEDAAAAVWSGQPANVKVYHCSYAGSTPKRPVLPSCPPGTTPVVDGVGPVRTFFLDEHGHATEVNFPEPPQASEDCLRD